MWQKQRNSNCPSPHAHSIYTSALNIITLSKHTTQFLDKVCIAAVPSNNCRCMRELQTKIPRRNQQNGKEMLFNGYANKHED